MKTLDQHLDDCIEHHQSLNRSPVYLRVLRFSVRRLLRWLETRHGVRHASELNMGHLDGWAKQVVAHRTGKGLPLKPASVSKQFESDRVFIEWLEKNGLVAPKLNEALPLVKRPDLLPQSVLVHADVENALNRMDTSTAGGVQMRAMVELLYSSGIRPIELLGLNVDHVDLTNASARVLGKGQKERMVPFGLTARRFLESYLKGIRPLLLRDPAQPALWLNRAGERMPYHTFRRLMVSAMAKLNLGKPVTAYTFRRSCATELIKGGANLWIVKMLLGHEQFSSLQHYIRTTNIDVQQAHAKCHPRERDRR